MLNIILVPENYTKGEKIKMSNSQRNEKEKRAFVKYFELIFSNASKLISLNLVYFLCLIPLLCVSIYLSCILFDISPEVIQSVYFVHLAVWITESIPFPVILALLIFSIVIYGPITAGFTYCIRNIATSRYCWISDMFSHAKSNIKQGIALGIADLVVVSSCFLYLSSNTSMLAGAGLITFRIAQVVSIVVTLIYVCVRFYAYTIVVTFNMKIKDILKNTLIFCVLGFFRNIVAIVVSAFIIYTFISTPRVDVVLIAALLFSLCRFTAVFSTYPVIEKYMLKNVSADDTKEGSNL